MSTEEKIRFIDPPVVDEFLSALARINHKLSIELAEEIRFAHEDINLETKLIVGNKFYLSYIIETYETLNRTYWSLYYNGSVNAFVKLFDKCVSLEYIMELIDGYVYALKSNAKQFLKINCRDEECHPELAVIHLGLFNGMRLLYPCIDCNLVKFTKVNVCPLKKGDLLNGIKFSFRFHSDEYEEAESFVEYAIEFSKMRRCAVVQSVKCMQPSFTADSDLVYCHLVDRSEQDIGRILANWKLDRK